MELSDEQKQQVAEWVSAGEGLAEVQRRIESEFGLQMTYMDVRFLVDDLDLDLVDKNAPQPTADASSAASAATDVDAELVDPAPGRVHVEVDAVMRPGAMVSGTVTFSDGESMGWQVDEMGRLGLIPGSAGSDYRPSEQDVMAFQESLEAELRKKGM